MRSSIASRASAWSISSGSSPSMQPRKLLDCRARHAFHDQIADPRRRSTIVRPSALCCGPSKHGPIAQLRLRGIFRLGHGTTPYSGCHRQSSYPISSLAVLPTGAACLTVFLYPSGERTRDRHPLNGGAAFARPCDRYDAGQGGVGSLSLHA
jgi:hypothetical protein